MTLSDLKFRVCAIVTLGIGVLGFIPGIPLPRVNKLCLVEFCCLFFVSVYLIKNKLILAFILWCLLRVLFDVNKVTVLSTHTLFFVIIFYSVFRANVTRERIDFVLNIICVIALIQCLMMVLQYFGVWVGMYAKGMHGFIEKIYFGNSLFPIVLYKQGVCRTDIIGLFDNINMSSAFLGICSPAFFRGKLIWFLLVIVLGMVLAGALVGLVTLAACLIIYLAVRLKLKSLYFIAPLIAAGIFFIFRYENLSQLITLSGRVPIWKHYIQNIIPAHWLSGFGLGMGVTLWPDVIAWSGIGSVTFHSHNELITLWTELGIIGFLIAVIYFFWIIAKSFKCNIVLSLGIIACILASNSIWIAHASTGLILLAYMAMAERSINEFKV